MFDLPLGSRIENAPHQPIVSLSQCERRRTHERIRLWFGFGNRSLNCRSCRWGFEKIGSKLFLLDDWEAFERPFLFQREVKPASSDQLTTSLFVKYVSRNAPSSR